MVGLRSVRFRYRERTLHKACSVHTERKTIMLIEDIDYSTAPEITLACAKCHAENGFKTEIVFTDMTQLSKLVDEDVFSILHLGLQCPHDGDCNQDILSIEGTCAPECIIEDWRDYVKFATIFNHVVDELEGEFGLGWNPEITRFVAMAAIDRETMVGYNRELDVNDIPTVDEILAGFCMVDESFYEYFTRDIWEGTLADIPEDAHRFFDLGRYADYMEAWYSVINIPNSSLVAIFSE